MNVYMYKYVQHVYMNMLSLSFLQDDLPNLRTNLYDLIWSVSTWCILENLFVQTIFLKNIQKNTRCSFVNSLFTDIINTVHVHHNSFVILIIGWGVPTKSTNIKPPLIQVIPQNRIVQFVSIFFQKKWRFSPVICLI